MWMGVAMMQVWVANVLDEIWGKCPDPGIHGAGQEKNVYVEVSYSSQAWHALVPKKAAVETMQQWEKCMLGVLLTHSRHDRAEFSG